MRTDGRMIAVTGKSRSGKTLWTREATRKDKRLLVWDPEGQWAAEAGCRRVTSYRELRSICQRKRSTRRDRIAYVRPASLEEFNRFCAVAMAWTIAAPATIVAEELADVSSPAKAPKEWGVLLRRGLKYGAWIYGITQRPQESDKTILGNATVIHTHQLRRASDRRYLAEEMDLPVERLAALQQLEWIERWEDGSEAEGRITL